MNQIKFYSLLIVSSLILYSCGGGETTSEGTEGSNLNTTTTPAPMETSPASPEASSPAAAEGEVVELSLEGNDQMQYNKKELRVKAGQTVRLTLTHVGTMPK